MSRRYCCLSIVLCCGALAAAQAPAAPEYQLKAAFVSKFPKFTEWPQAALDNRKSIDICVAARNPFGRALADRRQQRRRRHLRGR